MKTRLAALATAALLGALAGGSGCADNRASVQIQHVCGPPSSCDFTSGCDQFIGFVALDRNVATTGEMDVYLQVENQLPDNEDLGTGRLNTNDAHVDELVLEYEGAVAGEASVGLSTTVPAGGVSVVKVPLSFGSTATANGEALVRVRMRGFYDDGTRFETGDFPISVNVCSGASCTPAVPSGSLTACPNGTCPPGRVGQSPLTCAD